MFFGDLGSICISWCGTQDPQALPVTAKGRRKRQTKCFIKQFVTKCYNILRTQMTTVGSIYLYSFQEVNDLAGTDDWERLVFFFLLQTDVTL